MNKRWRSHYPLFLTLTPLLLLTVGLILVDGSHEGLVLILLLGRLVEFGHVEGLILQRVDGAGARIVLAGIQEVGEGQVFRQDGDSFEDNMGNPSGTVGAGQLQPALLMREGEVGHALLAESVPAGREQPRRIGISEWLETARAGDFRFHSSYRVGYYYYNQFDGRNILHILQQ
jgi:hypothetical protein